MLTITIECKNGLKMVDVCKEIDEHILSRSRAPPNLLAEEISSRSRAPPNLLAEDCEAISLEIDVSVSAKEIYKILRRYPAMKRLIVQIGENTEESKGFLKFLLRLPKLVELEIIGYQPATYRNHGRYPGFSFDLNYLRNSVNLKTLILDTTSLKTLAGIENLVSLEELLIYGAPELEDLHGIEYLQNLRRLTVIKTKARLDVSLLAGMPIADLCTSSIENCDELDLSGLDHLQGLVIRCPASKMIFSPEARPIYVNCRSTGKKPLGEIVNLNVKNLRVISLTRCRLTNISFLQGARRLTKLFLCNTVIDLFSLDDLRASKSLEHICSFGPFGREIEGESLDERGPVMSLLRSLIAKTEKMLTTTPCGIECDESYHDSIMDYISSWPTEMYEELNFITGDAFTELKRSQG